MMKMEIVFVLKAHSSTAHHISVEHNRITIEVNLYAGTEASGT